jgi:hypothetical protein
MDRLANVEPSYKYITRGVGWISIVNGRSAKTQVGDAATCHVPIYLRHDLDSVAESGKEVVLAFLLALSGVQCFNTYLNVVGRD